MLGTLSVGQQEEGLSFRDAVLTVCGLTILLWPGRNKLVSRDPDRDSAAAPESLISG